MHEAIQHTRSILAAEQTRTKENLSLLASQSTILEKAIREENTVEINRILLYMLQINIIIQQSKSFSLGVECTGERFTKHLPSDEPSL